MIIIGYWHALCGSGTRIAHYEYMALARNTSIYVLYIYIYIYRERERHTYIYIYIYTHIYNYISLSEPGRHVQELRGNWSDYEYMALARNTSVLCEAMFRRRQNMVGVNMAGVDNVAHDALCECFQGTMFKPCLLQPCFHVAGCYLFLSHVE